MRTVGQPLQRVAAIGVCVLLALWPGAMGAIPSRDLPDDASSAMPVTSGVPEVPWLEIRTQELLDLDKDGRSDAMRIAGVWLTPTGDSVTVYDHGGDMPAVEDYRQALDFDDSTWVFDVGNRNAASLIIRFVTEDEQLVAYLWDDQDGDGRVAYQVDGRSVQVTESPYWTMKVWTTETWMRDDGSLNLNLHALIDGCGFCNKMPGTAGYPPRVLARMPIDGNPDFSAAIVDLDGDGTPENFSWRMLTYISEEIYGLPRFGMMGNEGGSIPAPPTGFLFWPLLTPVEALPDGNYLATSPHIPVDWEASKIDLLNLSGYPIEHGFHINSLAYAPEGATGIYTNFEAPMAYYDLANDHDDRPELHVRVAYGAPHDPIMGGGQLDFPLEEIRYSWNQANTPALTWDYKLGLAGKYAVDSVQRSGNLDVKMVPYDELPSWVTEREWEIRTLIATQPGASYQSSEGLYEWTAASALDYIAGTTTDPPVYSGLPHGMRGEYSLEPGRPELYFDPIDRQLHLVGAEQGIWRLTDERQVRYLQLTPDPGFDGWQVWSGLQLVSQLYRVPGGLLYSDQTQTLYLRADISAELFRTLPPANHDEWVALGEQLEVHARQIAPGDLRAMFDQFGGTPVRLANGPISDFRHDDGGIRFVIEAADEATQDVLALLTGSRPGPGPQVVTLADDQWALAAGTYTTSRFAIAFDEATALRASSIHVAVVNDGSMAIDDAVVDVFAVAADGRRFALLVAAPVEVNGQDKQMLEVEWSPRTAGNWTLEVVLRRPAGNQWSDDAVVLAKTSQPFDVRPASPTAFDSTARLGWPGVAFGRMIVLVALIGMTGVVARYGFGRGWWAR